RQASGLFLAEGLKLVTEAVELGRTPRTLLYGPEAAGQPLLMRVAEATAAAGGDVVEVSRAILEKVSRRDNPQAVLGVFAQTFAALDGLDPGASPCWVALEG